MTARSFDRQSFLEAINVGNGVLRLEPCWVPRSFLFPGGRLRLHPDDLYALGARRGGRARVVAGVGAAAGAGYQR